MISNFVLIRIITIVGALILIGILIAIRFALVKEILKKDILVACRLIIGKEEIQEDDVGYTETENGLIAVLADGLGKKESGRISSLYAVKEIQEMFKNEGSNEMQGYFFKKAYNKANHEIMQRVESDKGGASVLSVIINEGYLHYALVGDAMLAIFRRNELFKVSKGHSIDVIAQKQYLEGKIEKNKAISVIKDKKLLYYLGNSSYGNNLELNEEPIKLYKGDIIILCSKGVYKGIRWIELENILRQKKDVEEICNQIMYRVDKSNNGSILVMKYTVKNK